MQKRKISKGSVMIVVVLTVIAVASGLILGGMNKLTAVDGEKALIDRINKLYTSPIARELDESVSISVLDADILRAFVAEDGAYIIQSKSNKAYDSDGLTLIVIIKDGIILKIDGSGNSETPGLGSKALSQDFFEKNYVGLDIDILLSDSDTHTSASDADVAEAEFSLDWTFQKEFSSGSSSGKLAAVSGATKTSDGVRAAVMLAAFFYDSMTGGEQ